LRDPSEFLVGDVDAEYERITALGVEWVMKPAAKSTKSIKRREPAGVRLGG
jgi:hypothetical protein